jgi:uncharacterized delta-60 repeat protein
VKRVATFLGLALLPLCLLGASSAANLPLAGNLDPSFGSAGAVTRSSGSDIRAIAVQPDGRVVVAGDAPSAAGFALARYLPDGSPDPSFGIDGYAETHFPASAFASAVAVQPNGKIVVAGSSVIPDTSKVSEFALARFNPNGSLDTSFGTDGSTTTFIPVSGSPARAAADALAVLPDGEILAGGTAGWDNPTTYQSSSSFTLVLYRADGSLDSTFGDGGIVQTAFDGNLQLDSIAVRPDGKIVAAGGAYAAAHEDDTTRMAIVRYAPDGSLDSTFGNGGKVATRAVLNYQGGPATIQAGKIVLAGATHNGILVLARYTANGRLDTTFGNQGFAKEITRLQGGPTAVLAQSDGKILIAAPTNAGGYQSGPTTIARVLPNGRLDPSFGRGGTAAVGAFGSSLALQADDKILVGGGNNGAWNLARLLGGDNCVVPVLRSKTVSKASAELKTAYCRSGRISKRYSNKVARGRVIFTAPPRGSRLPGGAKVEVVVSRGKR